MIKLGILFIVTYLLGAIPTSFILGKWLNGVDIRQQGSGNVGGTNAMRVLGKGPGIFTIIFDMVKGFGPVFFLAPWLYVDVGLSLVTVQIITGLIAVVGHIWPVYLEFKGGKGVATGAGVLFALAPIPVVVSLIAFLLTILVTRYVSLGSIIGAILIPVTLSIQKFYYKVDVEPALLIMAVILVTTVIVTHRANIRRLLRGEERKVGQKKNGEK